MFTVTGDSIDVTGDPLFNETAWVENDLTYARLPTSPDIDGHWEIQIPLTIDTVPVPTWTLHTPEGEEWRGKSVTTTATTTVRGLRDTYRWQLL